MGRLAGQSMLDHAGFDRALAWHMQANLYPPPPDTMTPVAYQAIKACNEGEIDRPIDLPAGVRYRGQPTAQAWEIVEAFRLEFFLDESDEEMGAN